MGLQELNPLTRIGKSKHGLSDPGGLIHQYRQAELVVIASLRVANLSLGLLKLGLSQLYNGAEP